MIPKLKENAMVTVLYGLGAIQQMDKTQGHILFDLYWANIAKISIPDSVLPTWDVQRQDYKDIWEATAREFLRSLDGKTVIATDSGVHMWSVDHA